MIRSKFGFLGPRLIGADCSFSACGNMVLHILCPSDFNRWLSSWKLSVSRHGPEILQILQFGSLELEMMLSWAHLLLLLMKVRCWHQSISMLHVGFLMLISNSHHFYVQQCTYNSASARCCSLLTEHAASAKCNFATHFFAVTLSSHHFALRNVFVCAFCNVLYWNALQWYAASFMTWESDFCRNK